MIIYIYIMRDKKFKNIKYIRNNKQKFSQLSLNIKKERKEFRILNDDSNDTIFKIKFYIN